MYVIVLRFVGLPSSSPECMYCTEYRGYCTVVRKNYYHRFRIQVHYTIVHFTFHFNPEARLLRPPVYGLLGVLDHSNVNDTYHRPLNTLTSIHIFKTPSAAVHFGNRVE
jgi:hypothetical protein